MAEATINLGSVLVPTKISEFDVPGFPGFKVKLAFPSRQEINNMTKAHTITKINKDRYGKGTSVEELDKEKFQDAYLNFIVRGWTGLKGKYLQDLVPSELTEDQMEIELPYSSEACKMLIENSPEFDGFVSVTANELSNFTKNSSK